MRVRFRIQIARDVLKVPAGPFKTTIFHQSRISGLAEPRYVGGICCAQKPPFYKWNIECQKTTRIWQCWHTIPPFSEWWFLTGDQKMTDCIFCKIVRGEIPSTKIYEDQFTLAFLDIMPANKGHCLVMPKNHYETFTDVPPEEVDDLFAATQKISKAMSSALGMEGYNILVNDGKIAGQIIPHLHLHIIPRSKGDRVKLSWSHKKYKCKEIEKIKEKIVKFL